MKRTDWKGSMTVELAIIFPVIFLTILGILSMCLVHYQNIVTGSAAMEAAARGANYWDKIGGAGAWDFQTSGAETSGGNLVGMDFEHHDPYRYLFDGNEENRLKNVEAFAKWRMGQNPDVTFGEETTSAPEANKGGFNDEGMGLLQKYITVSVSKRYTNPLDTLLERVGIKLPEERKITASAPLNTPVEFIRNMSFLSDWVHEVGYKGD